MNGEGHGASSFPTVKLRSPVDRKNFFNASLVASQNFVFRFILYVRAFIFVLQLIFSRWNFSTDAFKGIPLAKDEETQMDSFIWRCFHGFHQWDAVHMTHIAEHGYVLESSLAFFPLFPYLIRYLSYLAYPFIYFELVHISSVFLVTAFIVNLICFSAAARLLHEIVYTLSCSHKQAIISVLLFAVNPASIFFSSAYTESLFALLTFAGIWFLIAHEGSFSSRFGGALFCFALSYATRSNGLMNLGYVAFYCSLRALFPYGKSGERSFVLSHGIKTTICNIVLLFVQMLLAVVCVSSLVFLHGKYQQSVFCSSDSSASVSPSLMSLARNEGVATMGQTNAIDWCRNSDWLVPPFYSSIQTKYWHVSWFGYWKLSKIPCFLMATPALLLIIYGVYRLVHAGRRHLSISSTPLKALERFLDSDDGVSLPFTVHAAVIGFGSLFLWNAEVLTRLLFSSSPFAYLVLSKWMAESTPRVRLSDLVQPSHMPFLSFFCHRGRLEMAFFLYFLGYTVLGTNLHVMGLPFT